MCRLLGITGFKYSEHRDLLMGFMRLAETGRLLPGDPPGHADGWGLGWYRGAEAVVFKSGGSMIAERAVYEAELEKIDASPVLIAHLRKSAWPATSTAEHAHPFAFGGMMFAHNGTVRDYRSLLPHIGAELLPAPGALDTEVLFRFIMGRCPGDTGASFREAVRFVREHNRYSALNSLLSDGRALYACRDFTAHPEYYALYRASFGRSTVVSSEPLAGAEWSLLGNGEMITEPAS